ncbi:hypothetical protein C8D04_2155 [Simplicispira sp. 125]|nr:hypothetical protein C8D04_2155 [Simplicispira sp. 125]REG17832.1 hypothetical protein C8D01_2465 [Simplicispira sp. 110]
MTRVLYSMGGPVPLFFACRPIGRRLFFLGT